MEVKTAAQALCHAHKRLHTGAAYNRAMRKRAGWLRRWGFGASLDSLDAVDLFDGLLARKQPWWRHRVIRRAAVYLVGVSAILALTAVAGLVVLLVWRAPQLLYEYVPDLNQRATAEASTRTGLIAGLAGFAALGGLAVSSRTYRLAQQGQITDRYTKSTEQLGAGKLEIRLGGIYALERIAVDSKRDHSTVVEVLSAFVREHASSHGDKEIVAEVAGSVSNESQPKLAVDVQAAVTVLGRLPNRKGIQRGDLQGALLVGAELKTADLRGAALHRANLSGAVLADANLSKAKMWGTNFSGATICGTNLSDANLAGADLSGARLWGVNLSGALLLRANLSGAHFLRARLAGAELMQADVTEADLSGSAGLTQNQLDETIGDETTQLADELETPAAWN
jgi:hypothetical protein